MICFRDMTFCGSCCINRKCDRNFSWQEEQEARKWWAHDPDNAPVEFSDFSGDCKDFIPPKDMFKC